MIYLDNASTSWPKPNCVTDAMIDFMKSIGANPGRAGHRLANESANLVYDARESVAELFNVSDPLRIIFAPNITYVLNLIITGLLNSGDHVICTSVEHNSVMRPLRDAEKNLELDLTVIQCRTDGTVDSELFRSAIKSNTKLIIVNHASNVTGTILPITEIGRIARDNEILFCVDSAQTAGSISIDVEQDNIDLLAFTGHKSMYGPMGTGGLVLGENINVGNFKRFYKGGTGSASEFEIQPDFLPDIFESGTQNIVGIAGLNAGVRWILKNGIKNIRDHEKKMTNKLISGLIDINRVKVYGTCDFTKQISVVSFTISDLSTSEVGFLLDKNYDIMSRIGLHCSPGCHKTIGTFPTGTIRFAIGYFNTENDIDLAIDAVYKIAHNKL